MGIGFWTGIRYPHRDVLRAVRGRRIVELSFWLRVEPGATAVETRSGR